MRKRVRHIHLWLGLASGLILSVLGITGSLYVFEPEIGAWLEREYYQTKAEENLFATDVALADFVEDRTQANIESLQWPRSGRETYLFKLFDDPNWYYLDQTTGVITSAGASYGNAFFDFLLDLHTTLTLGETGRVITATAALLFALFMLSTGLYLWWPHNWGRWKSSFKIKWRAKPKRRNYDLHNVTGFYFFLPLFLIGITGAYFHYEAQIQGVVDLLTWSEPAPEPIWGSTFSDTTQQRQPLTIAAALENMDRHYPNYSKRNMWMSAEKDGTLSFAYQRDSQRQSGPTYRIFLQADRYTGAILGEYNSEKLPRGAALAAKWLLPVHVGDFGGLVTRIIWFFAGLMPALLTYSGVKIWLGRGRKSTKVVRRKPSVPEMAES